MTGGIRTLFLLTDDRRAAARLIGAANTGPALAEVVRFEEGVLDLRWADGSEARFSMPNMLCLGLAVLSNGTDWAEPLRSWWRQTSGWELPIYVAGTDGQEPLAAWVLQRAFAALELINTENRELVSQNMHLRQSYNALQTAFSRLETFVVSNKLHNPVLHCEVPATAFWRPAADGARLVQVLPVLSDKLTYFELNFRPSELSPTGGVLRARLMLQPASRVHQTWEIGYREIEGGWQQFSPSPIIDDVHEAVLELEWSAAASAPAVGLSPPHWNSPYGSVPEDRTGQTRTLAMRIWSGFAGVRPPRIVSPWTKFEARQGEILPIPPEVIAKVTQYKYAATVERPYSSIQFHSGHLVVHPHMNATTIACFPAPLPSGTTHVAATCMTRHREASRIEYAMAIIHPEVAAEHVFDGNTKLAEGFAGWLALDPMQGERLSITMERPASPDALIYVATRLTPGAHESYAWAGWTGFEIGIDWRPPTPALTIIDGAEQAASPEGSMRVQTKLATQINGRSGA